MWPRLFHSFDHSTRIRFHFVCFLPVLVCVCRCIQEAMPPRRRQRQKTVSIRVFISRVSFQLKQKIDKMPFSLPAGATQRQSDHCARIEICVSLSLFSIEIDFRREIFFEWQTVVWLLTWCIVTTNSSHWAHISSIESTIFLVDCGFAIQNSIFLLFNHWVDLTYFHWSTGPLTIDFQIIFSCLEYLSGEKSIPKVQNYSPSMACWVLWFNSIRAVRPSQRCSPMVCLTL